MTTMTGSNTGEDLMVLFERMLVIRQAENRLATLFADGEIPGFIHLSVGQEAVAVGVTAALGPRDTIASTHRGHGHAIGKGLDLNRFFLELLGKDEGFCRGRGGSMHVADASVGMLGANGIVGAGIPIALGSAFAHQVRKNGSVAVAFFGDGALAEGVLHESLNLAALWKLPMLFVCENNGWSEFSPGAAQFAAKLSDLGTAFGLESRTVDGNDVIAVIDAARDLVESTRQGHGAKVLECVTKRRRGHFEGDPQKYRDAADLQSNDADDPILRLEKRLVETGVPESLCKAARQRVEAEVETAIAQARKGSAPDFESAFAEVYAEAR